MLLPFNLEDVPPDSRDPRAIPECYDIRESLITMLRFEMHFSFNPVYSIKGTTAIFCKMFLKINNLYSLFLFFEVMTSTRIC